MLFSKNQGNKQGLKGNLREINPQQFGDHQYCKPRFCGFLRVQGEVYQHRSLPYKSALKDIFKHIIANAEQYIDLGSSQQCEHANREVTESSKVPSIFRRTTEGQLRVSCTKKTLDDVVSKLS